MENTNETDIPEINEHYDNLNDGGSPKDDLPENFLQEDLPEDLHPKDRLHYTELIKKGIAPILGSLDSKKHQGKNHYNTTWLNRYITEITERKDTSNINISDLEQLVSDLKLMETTKDANLSYEINKIVQLVGTLATKK